MLVEKRRARKSAARLEAFGSPGAPCLQARLEAFGSPSTPCLPATGAGKRDAEIVDFGIASLNFSACPPLALPDPDAK